MLHCQLYGGLCELWERDHQVNLGNMKGRDLTHIKGAFVLKPVKLVHNVGSQRVCVKKRNICKYSVFALIWLRRQDV